MHGLKYFKIMVSKIQLIQEIGNDLKLFKNYYFKNNWQFVINA